MSKLVRHGTEWKVYRDAAVHVADRLPPNLYVVQADAYAGFLISEIDGFPHVKTVYGDVAKTSKRVVQTFLDRPAATGVLLCGDKGSGKTLTAKTIVNALALKGIPTLLVNQPHVGDKFNDFLQSIPGPCCVFFDEFEKVYNSEAQPGLLTLLDGVYPAQRLFLLTCNDVNRIDSHMLNRPGRIYYSLTFSGVSESVARKYCKDNLKHAKHLDAVVKLTKTFCSFNFDMLKALVEEINRYGEAPAQAMKILNIRPSYEWGLYDVAITMEGVQMTVANGYTRFCGQVVSDDGVHLSWSDRSGEEPIHYSHCFTPVDLVSYDQEHGRFVFKNGDAVCTFTRSKVANPATDVF